MPIQFGGPGVTPLSNPAVPSVIELQAGEVWLVPSGRWSMNTGKYTVFQQYDPVSTTWRSIGGGAVGGNRETVFSDGVNYRLANQTGCAVGALLTNAGSGYTSAPTVTASAGSSKWLALIGGAVNTSVTVSNGGTNYTYPPTVLFSAPPSPGVQATGYCTLSGGAVQSVTVTDQGAGYNTPPTITFVNDPREGLNGTTVGTGAAAVATLTGAGTVTAVLCLDHGNAVTSVPTLTFSGGGGSSAAATAIMNFTITAYNVSATTAGSGYSTPVLVSAYGGFPGTNPAYTNPSTQANLVKGRNAQIVAAVSAGALTTTGQTVNDGGIYPGVPTAFAYPGPYGSATVAAVLTSPSVGGVNDASTISAT